jgi:HlyD family secretion protein
MTFRVSRRRGPWLATAAAVAVLAGVTVGYLLLGNDKVESAPPPTIQIERSDVTSSVAASGKVQPVSIRELAFSRAGTLTSVNVKAGDTVAPGQILAAIDPADAQEDVDEAEDALASAKQTLSDAKAAAAAAAAAAASPEPTRGPGGGGSNSSSSSRGDSIYTAQTNVNKAQLALDKAERVLAGTEITAPVAGKILKVSGKAGDAAGTSTFITIGVVEKMMVEAAFAEADAVNLAVGQAAQVTLASHAGQTYPVTVTQVAALGTVSNRLVRYTVLLAFDAPPADLLIGQSATAQVVVQRAAKVLRLPQSAVKMISSDKGQARLPDGSLRSVGVGLRGDGFVEITSGLADGEKVRVNAR